MTNADGPALDDPMGGADLADSPGGLHGGHRDRGISG
jgi:hypothetical protein